MPILHVSVDTSGAITELNNLDKKLTGVAKSATKLDKNLAGASSSALESSQSQSSWQRPQRRI